MPELPDVELFKRYLDATSLHQRIDDVDVLDGYVLRDVSAGDLRDALKGRELTHTRRHGKHLFVATDAESWLMLHFGMTGFLRYFKHDADTPEYTRVLLRLNGGYHLAYVCQRKLGQVSLTDDPDAYIRDKGLGPDALGLSEGKLASLLVNSGAAAKSGLMDQGFIAGLGNIYTDEILFHAQIHPTVKLNTLDERTAHNLSRAIKDVLQAAIDAHARPDEMPSSFLLPHRSTGEPCPRCGAEVRKMQIGGRSTYYCPRCQPR